MIATSGISDHRPVVGCFSVAFDDAGLEAATRAAGNQQPAGRGGQQQYGQSESSVCVIS